jgi:hypothetical protein
MGYLQEATNRRLADTEASARMTCESPEKLPLAAEAGTEVLPKRATSPVKPVQVTEVPPLNLTTPTPTPFALVVKVTLLFDPAPVAVPTGVSLRKFLPTHTIILAVNIPPEKLTVISVLVPVGTDLENIPPANCAETAVPICMLAAIPPIVAEESDLFDPLNPDAPTITRRSEDGSPILCEEKV